MYMTGLIGLIIGFIVGILTMKLKTTQLKKKNILQESIFKKNTKKLQDYQKELNDYFDTNIRLLNAIANDHQELYRHIIENSNILITKYKDTKNVKNNLLHQIRKHHIDIKNTNQYLTEVPRDYPDNHHSK